MCLYTCTSFVHTECERVCMCVCTVVYHTIPSPPRSWWPLQRLGGWMESPSPAVLHSRTQEQTAVTLMTMALTRKRSEAQQPTSPSTVYSGSSCIRKCCACIVLGDEATSYPNKVCFQSGIAYGLLTLVRERQYSVHSQTIYSGSSSIRTPFIHPRLSGCDKLFWCPDI